MQGDRYGNPLSYYSDPKYMDKLMDISNNLTGYHSAMEKGEASDFIFVSGKNPKRYQLQEFYRKNQPMKMIEDKYGRLVWKDLKTKTDIEIDELWNNEIGKLKENDRRIYLNLGRDWYHKNSAPVGDYDYGFDDEGHMIKGKFGEWSPAYMNTWYGRIHNTNDFSEFDPKNQSLKHPSKRQYGGKVVDIDEDMINELIAAGADIEII